MGDGPGHPPKIAPVGRTPTLPGPAPRVQARAAARSTAFGLAAAFLVANLSAIGPFDRGASADALSKKRQEADRLANSIDAVNSRIEQLDEDELQTRDRLARLRASVRSTAAQVATSRLELDAMRSVALQAALRDYANPPTADVLVLRGSTTLNEAERRSIYRSQALATQRDTQDRLQAARDDYGLKQARLTRSRDTADRLAQSLAKRRKQADALVTRYEALERQAQGDLALLVDEAQKRQAAEEARLARVALEKRAELARKALAKLEADARRSALKSKNGKGTPLSAKSTATNAKARQLAVEAGVSAELPASPGGRTAVQIALSQLGKPYVWGAAGPGSYDCSGLMLYAWRAAGKSLPHSSRSQFSSTTRVAVSQIKPGDLVFYGAPIHHVGMYVGDGQMVEASRRGKPVKMASIFRRDLVGVGRVG